ncbi:hypothetical protein V0M98_37785 (plasmid) [Pseudomonas silesiensis]|uniref:hypothetical protein n=1 Tax=Pseudomonas silesiensis TaxID=1853130 RepID=UPI0030CC47C2
MRYVMLRDRKVVETDDVHEWLAANDYVKKRVVRTTFPSGAEISTDFFKCMVGEFDDLLAGFESMVFGGPLDGLRVRFDTWEEAEAGHALFCAEIRKREAELKEIVEKGASMNIDPGAQ